MLYGKLKYGDVIKSGFTEDDYCPNPGKLLVAPAVDGYAPEADKSKDGAELMQLISNETIGIIASSSLVIEREPLQSINPFILILLYAAISDSVVSVDFRCHSLQAHAYEHPPHKKLVWFG